MGWDESRATFKSRSAFTCLVLDVLAGPAQSVFQLLDSSLTEHVLHCCELVLMIALLAHSQG